MKNIPAFLVISVLALSGCKSDYKKAPNGMLYIKYTDNNGPKIKAGDFVAINMIVRTDADSLIGSSYESGIPRFLTLPKPIFSGDYFDALTLMSLGDSLSVKMSDDSIFKHSARPLGFKGNFVIYDLKVIRVIPKVNLSDTIFQEKINAYLNEFAIIVKNREPAKIRSYLAKTGSKFSKTDSGLYYHLSKAGTGPRAMVGDTVVINYTGELFNGKVFDTNVAADAIKSNTFNQENKYEPVHFPIDKTKAFPGINEGLLLLNKGASATFIIPSKLAYGANGHNIIGPYTPLVYKVAVFDIIHPKQKKK